jgi:hydrogenase maturation protease
VTGAGRPVLIGIGNAYRNDDGIGPAVVAAINELKLDGVRSLVSDGEPGRLLDAWSGATLAVVVDAVRGMAGTPRAPVRFYRSYWQAGSGAEQAFVPTGPASTHGLGIVEALGLGQVLDRMPERLVLFAVEVEDIGYGTHLSEAVAFCLPDLVNAVLAELDAG